MKIIQERIEEPSALAFSRQDIQAGKASPVIRSLVSIIDSQKRQLEASAAAGQVKTRPDVIVPATTFKVAGDSHLEQVVDAVVIDPDAVAAKALESLNGAWDGSEPYPPAIYKAILALEKHAETLMADAEQAALEREALDLRNIVFTNTATEWADLTREAKAKWLNVALRAREFRSKDAQ